MSEITIDDVAVTRVTGVVERRRSRQLRSGLRSC